MPRVAVVCTSYPAHPGDPSGHFVETEARALARSAEVVVVTAAASGQASGVSVDGRGVTVWRLRGGDAFGWPGVVSRVRRHPLRAASVMMWAERARQLFAHLPAFDRLVCHWAVPSALPVLASSLRPPLELVSHGADVRLLASLPSGLRRVAIGALLGRATHWRFVSDSLRSELALALSPAEARRLARIASVSPAAIELPDVRERSSTLRAREGAGRLVVLAGRLVEGKRFGRALERVASQGAAGTRVVVVGDGPERRRLEAYARDLGVDARFVGTVAREETLAWIGAADAIVHASRTEGLSTVVREAEALGTPVDVVL